jgi:hypothetical protein
MPQAHVASHMHLMHLQHAPEHENMRPLALHMRLELMACAWSKMQYTHYQLEGHMRPWEGHMRLLPHEELSHLGNFTFS